MHHFFHALKWILITLLLIPVSFYLIVVLINIKDEAPSEQAKTYLTEIENINSNLANNLENNAYLFALGFDVAKDLSPLDIGIKRFEQIQSQGKAKKYKVAAFKKPQLPIDECLNKDDFVSACKTALNKDGHIQLDEYLWLLERYQQLLNIGTWQDDTNFSTFSESTPFSSLLIAQKLYLLNLYANTNHIETSLIIDAINRDMRFWQQISADTHILITKMISNSAIEMNMKLGEIIITQLSKQEARSSLPQSWLEAVSPKILSLNKVKIGEWSYFIKITQATQVIDDSADIATKLAEWLLLPLMQHQDTANRYAAILAGTSPLKECPRTLSLDVISQYVYNPMGKFILCSGIPSFKRYQESLDKLESKRASLVERLQQ
ncbi:hypothetical protein [Shewanella psychrotolerans]|uniref:hypothetical protein n=1 Tax=Shewanella psychrotolerans TaxID=2864206 RepID=UPI001C65FC86|nr:hypothetical protein [Shewanella psychrotolerans]QYK02360.1 hypothetical protein K0I62_05200 [Shewanella psychrotolerans]